MSIDTIKSEMPHYAKDIKLNISSLTNDETLSSRQLWGTFLVSALACGNDFIIQQVSEEAENYLSSAEQEAVKAAASIMAMNNIY